jgi:hypothetical protein
MAAPPSSVLPTKVPAALTPCEKSGLDEGFSLIDELGTLIGERFFGLQRVVWASESQQPLQIEDTWDEYYAVVLQWNRRLIVNRARILRIFGADEARRFLNYSDENQPSLPQSVHGHFRKAHEAVLSLSQCVQTKCKDESRLLNASRQALNDLDILTDEYVERLAATLVSQAESMKLDTSIYRVRAALAVGAMATTVRSLSAWHRRSWRCGEGLGIR